MSIVDGEAYRSSSRDVTRCYSLLGSGFVVAFAESIVAVAARYWVPGLETIDIPSNGLWRDRLRLIICVPPTDGPNLAEVAAVVKAALEGGIAIFLLVWSVRSRDYDLGVTGVGASVVSSLVAKLCYFC